LSIDDFYGEKHMNFLLATRHLRAASRPLALGMLCGVACSVSWAATTAYEVTDLGVLNGGTYASARAINLPGKVIGMVMDGTTLTNKQALWSGGSVTVWSNCCGAGSGIPTRLNNGLEAVGYESAGYASGPLYWDATGKVTPLPSFPGTVVGWGFAYDINVNGLIAGQTQDANNMRHAVVWNRKVLQQDLGTLMGASSSSARGINDQGDVVGDADGYAFLWRNGALTRLGAGAALDINNNGLILGNAPGMVPVLWRNGVMENLRALSGTRVAYGHTATGINNRNEVVGYAPAVKPPYQHTAVLWSNGRAFDLGRFPGGTVSRAYGINDNGQIVGEGNLMPNGPMHALRWTLKGTPAVAAEASR
jgi:uncharacterized membrane protein